MAERETQASVERLAEAVALVGAQEASAAVAKAEPAVAEVVAQVLALGRSAKAMEARPLVLEAVAPGPE